MSRHLYDAHLAMVERANAATTREEHEIRSRELSAWRAGVRAVFVDYNGGDSGIGDMIMDADWHYLNQGIDRPMCGGLWLDWEPS